MAKFERLARTASATASILALSAGLAFAGGAATPSRRGADAPIRAPSVDEPQRRGDRRRRAGFAAIGDSAQEAQQDGAGLDRRRRCRLVPRQQRQRSHVAHRRGGDRAQRLRRRRRRSIRGNGRRPDPRRDRRPGRRGLGLQHRGRRRRRPRRRHARTSRRNDQEPGRHQGPDRRHDAGRPGRDGADPDPHRPGLQEAVPVDPRRGGRQHPVAQGLARDRRRRDAQVLRRSPGGDRQPELDQALQRQPRPQQRRLQQQPRLYALRRLRQFARQDLGL
jgi:hypothetical protein